MDVRWQPQVRSSVRFTPRNSMLATLHHGAADVWRWRVHHHFFGFGNIELFKLLKGHQLFHLNSVHRLVVQTDKTYHRCVMGKLN